MDKADILYNYPLYSLKRFPTFLKYAKMHSKQIAQETGGWAMMILLDMIWCNLRYGAMDSRDYLLFDFYDKSGNARDAYLTKRRYFKMIKKFDLPTFKHLLVKANAYKDYSDFIHRKWMLIDHTTPVGEILDFINTFGTILVKPNTGEQGHGIFLATAADVNKIKEIVADGTTSLILEERVENCEAIKQINPSSLNTFRIYTILDKNEEPIILEIMLRAGAPNANVDNWGSGGVGYNFHLGTGICVRPGIDKKHGQHMFHPGTDFKMIGFEIPEYNKLVEFVKALACKNPKVKFAGWDIAMTPSGYELIEVNFPGGHDFLQVFGSPKNRIIKEQL